MQDWGQRDERWAGIRTDAVDVRGTPVRVLRADGPADGPRQLLIHGLGGAATNWLEVMGGLARNGPVAAPDLPGFGATAPPRGSAADVRANARFVPALCDALGWDRIVLHGNSMGGMIATLVAAHRPDLVDRLVLADPALPAARRDAHRIPPKVMTRFAPFVVPSVGRWVLGRAWERASIDELYADTIDLVYADPDRVRPAIREVAMDNLRLGRETDWRLPSFVAAARSVVALVVGRRTLTRAIDRIAAPTLVVWGSEDQLVSRPVIDELRRRRPDFAIRVLDGIGHAPMLEAPDRYLDEITTWMGRTSSDQPAGTTQ